MVEQQKALNKTPYNRKWLSLVKTCKHVWNEALESGSNIVIDSSSVVQFYRANSYLNTTLELFAENTEKVSAALKNAGFKSDAKGCWNSDNSVIQICFIERKNDDLYKETDKIITPLETILIAKKEDIILQCIIDGVDYENSSKWAEYLLFTHFDDIDMEYLQRS